MDAKCISTIIIAIITCALVISSLLLDFKFKKLSLYWVISLLGAIVVVLINISNIKDVLRPLVSNSSINPLKILIFFLSMTILSITLDNLGFFNYLATKCTALAKNSQLKLFLIFYLMVSVLTVFTSNDIVILAFVPFICYFCKNSNISPTPYVFSTFVAANTWSMTLVIGNPTNVYLASFANIDFVSYFLKMVLPTIVCAIVSLLVLLVLFKKQLKQKIEQSDIIEIKIDKPLVIFNAIILGCCTILLAISSYLNLEMWYIALGFAIFEIASNLIICSIKKQNCKFVLNSALRAPWAFVPFLISMFLIITCLNVNGVTKIISNIFSDTSSALVYGITSFLISNIMNNIPMTTLFASVLGSGTFDLMAVYATIIGSNLGALLSPVGALAGIMFLKILKEKQVDFSVKQFVKYGIIISIASLASSLAILYLV